VPAIPPERTERNLVAYLTDAEAEAGALLDACDDMDRLARSRHVRAHHIQSGLRQLPFASDRTAPYRYHAPPARRQRRHLIALWHGHEQISANNIYLHADMAHKQRATDRTRPLTAKPGRYRPPDTLLAFLEALCLRHRRARPARP
jgi:hypothetical protein